MNINKLWFPWKPAQFRLGTISENACLCGHYQCAKFHACNKKCTIRLKFRVMPPDYYKIRVFGPKIANRRVSLVTKRVFLVQNRLTSP